jgi:hypothetical protein
VSTISNGLTVVVCFWEKVPETEGLTPELSSGKLTTGFGPVALVQIGGDTQARFITWGATRLLALRARTCELAATRFEVEE